MLVIPTPSEERVVIEKYGRRAFEQTFTFPECFNPHSSDPFIAGEEIFPAYIIQRQINV